MIKFIPHNKVNKQLWDDCVNQSQHGLIYATSIYLDNLCPGWSAITGDAYEWVMPLTTRTKFGITYLYQPAFTQQLGVFANNHSVKIPWKEIIDYVKKRYRFWEIHFNYSTPSEIFGEGFTLQNATNFILPLHHPYASIREHYHKDLVKNLKRSQQFRLVCREAAYTKAIEQYIDHYSSRIKHVKEADYDRFRNICDQLSKENKVICREVVNQQNELMAIALLLSDGKRLYNMMNTTTDAGRKVEANHFLIDSVIREFAGQNILFDFEGSDLPGVKSFYENFGSTNQPFTMVKYNNLPWPIRLFK